MVVPCAGDDMDDLDMHQDNQNMACLPHASLCPRVCCLLKHVRLIPWYYAFHGGAQVSTTHSAHGRSAAGAWKPKRYDRI